MKAVLDGKGIFNVHGAPWIRFDSVLMVSKNGNYTYETKVLR